MRFLVDAQLPPALARRLADLGHVADHVGDLGLGNASDDTIWRCAIATGATIITKDEDFATWKVLRNAGPSVVSIRLRNTRRRELLLWFEAILPDLLQALGRGEGLVEVARDAWL